MTTKILKYTLFIATSLILQSCDVVMHEYLYRIDYYVDNRSSHDIEINETYFIDYINPNYKPGQLNVKSGEKALFYQSATEGAYPLWLPSGVCIIFDSELMVIHKYEEFNSMCNPENYKFEQVEKRVRSATFTFTDADYEYALENGERLTYE